MSRTPGDRGGAEKEEGTSTYKIPRVIKDESGDMDRRLEQTEKISRQSGQQQRGDGQSQIKGMDFQGEDSARLMLERYP